MSTPLGEIHLVQFAGTIILKRAALRGWEQTYDRAAFRAPQGTAWHEIGTGQPLPAALTVSGYLEGADRAASIALRDEAFALLPGVVTLAIGGWEIPVHGVTGPVITTTTLRGYQLQAQLVTALEPWAAVA